MLTLDGFQYVNTNWHIIDVLRNFFGIAPLLSMLTNLHINKSWACVNKRNLEQLGLGADSTAFAKYASGSSATHRHADCLNQPIRAFICPTFSRQPRGDWH